MTINMNALLPAAVLELNIFPYQFFLTGSRYFGNYTAQSDWDFFVEYGGDLIVKLRSIGFEQVSDSTYSDSGLMFLFQKQDQGTVVQIQIVRDVRIKRMAQYILNNRLKTKYMTATKEERGTLWSAVLETIDYMNQSTFMEVLDE